MKIKQVSEQTGLSAYTIRYYEKVGLLKKPSKNSSGHRVYDDTDVDLIGWVTCLKNSGMSLEKIKKYTQAFKTADKTSLSQLLQEHLDKLKSQQTDIKHYIDVTQKKLRKLKNA